MMKGTSAVPARELPPHDDREQDAKAETHCQGSVEDGGDIGLHVHHASTSAHSWADSAWRCAVAWKCAAEASSPAWSYLSARRRAASVARPSHAIWLRISCLLMPCPFAGAPGVGPAPHRAGFGDQRRGRGRWSAPPGAEGTAGDVAWGVPAPCPWPAPVAWPLLNGR
ncbi:MAG: hypothetical protein [Inoviridae sp.]|nr:MAG: hypothetical protein [Inoviridae sp.]